MFFLIVKFRCDDEEHIKQLKKVFIVVSSNKQVDKIMAPKNPCLEPNSHYD